MNLAQYQVEAQNTKSPQFYGSKVARNVFVRRVAHTIEVLKKLDEVKKALFYDKPALGIEPGLSETTCMSLQIYNLANEPQNGIDLLHAVLGIATEAGELLEALYSSTVANQNADGVNVFEEIGDVLWYQSIALSALYSSFEHCAEVNNAKLRKRFPNKFTEHNAKNRDLAGERATLEGGTSTVLNGMLEDASRESAGSFLSRVGTDADLWAREFVSKVEQEFTSKGGSVVLELDNVRAWFANAIEVGAQREANKTRKKVEQLQDLVKVQSSPGNFDADEYMRGMANGLICAESVFTGQEPKYHSMKAKDEDEPKTNEMFPVEPCPHHSDKEQCPYCRSRDPKPKPEPKQKDVKLNAPDPCGHDSEGQDYG